MAEEKGNIIEGRGADWGAVLRLAFSFMDAGYDPKQTRGGLVYVASTSKFRVRVRLNHGVKDMGVVLPRGSHQVTVGQRVYEGYGESNLVIVTWEDAAPAKLRVSRGRPGHPWTIRFEGSVEGLESVLLEHFISVVDPDKAVLTRLSRPEAAHDRLDRATRREDIADRCRRLKERIPLPRSVRIRMPAR